jgi:hypothetical protein
MADDTQPDYDQPRYVDRRVRYFYGQFLQAQDFIDEQRYHLDREHRLARIAHRPGVVEGLTVTAVGNAPKVTVAPGTALDAHGRLLVRADAGEPLDLTQLVDRDHPVKVLVALTYAQVAADAPQVEGSPRWREVPHLIRFREDDRGAPSAEDAPRLARLTLHPEPAPGRVTVDEDWTAPVSGLAVRGALQVRGPASFSGGIAGGQADGSDVPLEVRGPASFSGEIAGGRTADGSDTPLRARGNVRLTGPPAYDSTVRLDIVNGSADHGRANIVITGRCQQGNDTWSFGTAARNSIVFARNAVKNSGEREGAVGEEQVSLQLEGNSRALGFLTRDRGPYPALVLTQNGHVGVGTELPEAILEVGGDLNVRGPLAMGKVGQWRAEVVAGRAIQITIAANSMHNFMVLQPRGGLAPKFTVVLPSSDRDPQRWIGRYTCFDGNGNMGVTAALERGAQDPAGNPALAGDIERSMKPASYPVGLVLEVHHITLL